MKIILDEEMLEQYVAAAVEVSPDRPLLIDKFLEDAIESEADAISDGVDAFVRVMQHIEYAGIHSGDSACVIPSVMIPKKHKKTIYDYTRRIAIELKVVGLMNIQYAIYEDLSIFLKPIQGHQGQYLWFQKYVMFQWQNCHTDPTGKKLSDFKLKKELLSILGLKRLCSHSICFLLRSSLGPEMRSTGEVLGMADSYGMAFFKSQEATHHLCQ